MQAVGDLDDEHPGVARHRDDHLADGLALGGRAEHDLVEFGDAVDEVRDLFTELGGELLERVPGVLDGVVEQCRDEGRGIHAEFGEDRRDRQRVGDVRIAGLALLAGVPFLGDVVRALQLREVGLGIQLTVMVTSGSRTGLRLVPR